jgi:hypothetical protein
MMFAWGAEKRKEVGGEVRGAPFGCSKCKRPIELERVLGAEAERRGHGVTGYVVFRHSCPCTPVGTRASRNWGTNAAFCSLFGAQPWLPYRAPFRFQPVADDDPLAVRWSWELDQMTDADEFLLFLDDALARRRVP